MSDTERYPSRWLVAAWINMLLLSSSGPIKTPVGACATAAESVEVGVETILSQKARVVIVGGYDDFGEEVRTTGLASFCWSSRLNLTRLTLCPSSSSLTPPTLRREP